MPPYAHRPAGRAEPYRPDVGVPGLPDWQVIPTPGHTPGHLAPFREADRTLIAGDAVLTVDLNSLGDALSQKAHPRRATALCHVELASSNRVCV